MDADKLKSTVYFYWLASGRASGPKYLHQKKIKGQLANAGLQGKLVIKTMCVCVDACAGACASIIWLIILWILMQDLSKAFKFFSLAAEQGWVDGQLQLGIMYYSMLTTHVAVILIITSV